MAKVQRWILPREKKRKTILDIFVRTIFTGDTCDDGSTNELAVRLSQIKRKVSFLKQVLFAYVAEAESTAPGMEKDPMWNCGDKLDLPQHSKLSGMGGDGNGGHGPPIVVYNRCRQHSLASPVSSSQAFAVLLTLHTLAEREGWFAAAQTPWETRRLPL